VVEGVHLTIEQFRISYCCMNARRQTGQQQGYLPATGRDREQHGEDDQDAPQTVGGHRADDHDVS
jgi:hypothetical protein